MVMSALFCSNSPSHGMQHSLSSWVGILAAWSLALTALCASPVAAQSGTTGAVTGIVTTSDGTPAPGINARLEGTSLGAASDREGRFTIRRVPAGNYTLVLSYVGLQTQTRDVSVTVGETTTVPSIALEESTEALDELVVEGLQPNEFTTDRSAYVSKMPIRDIDSPKSYSVITSDLLRSQVNTSFEDALTNAPGLTKLWESTGRGGDGAGYYSLRGFATQPTMLNGAPALTNGTLDPANMERIEVMKGPSGTLYGGTIVSYGGLINVVTKKPYDSFGGEVSYNTGSFGLNRITADVNTPLGDTESVALRVNGAFTDQNSFQNTGFSRSGFIAPSLSVEASESLSFLVNAEYYTSERTNPTMLFLSRSSQNAARTPAELGYDPELSYTDNDLTISNPTFSLQARMRYEIAESWSTESILSRSASTSDGYYSYLFDASGGEGVFSRFISNQNATTTGTDLQQNLNGTFDLGPVENQFLAGVNYFQESAVNNSSGYIGFGSVDVSTQEDPGLNRSAVDAALAEAGATKTDTRQSTYSAYASNVFTIAPQLSVMAGVRVDRFDQDGAAATEDDDYLQTGISPQVGVVIQPLPDRLSLFGSYMNGFSNVAPRIQDDGTTQTFSPEQANQWEAGVKTDLFAGRVSSTVSYYHITVNDIVRQDPSRPNFFIQDGENVSQGVEASVTAAPVQGLNLIAGYSYNLSEVTRSANPEYQDRRPEQAGPEHLANGWIQYRLPTGVLEGFGLGFGGNFASDNVTLNRASTGQFVLPSYTVLNAAVSYTADTYRLALKVNNLTDETYYKGWSTVNPQAPRSITANFSYRF